MKLITGFQASRLVAQIAENGDPSSSVSRKAFDKLRKLGPGVIPTILEALRLADKNLTGEYVELLTEFADNKNLPALVRGLADGEAKTVAATAWALSSSRKFNVNRLVDLLSEDDYSKSAIVDVLSAHKDRLNVRQLLTQVYHLQPAEKAAVFKVIDEVATEDLVPNLIDRMDGKDSFVKMLLIDTISRFDLPIVETAITDALSDGNKLVRKSALASIARSGRTVQLAAISKLLMDSDVEVIDKAVDVIVQMNDDDTVKYLIEPMKSENEFSRRAAVEILNKIGTTSSVKFLLNALADEDWWVRSRAADALAHIGGERVVSSVLELFTDKDENIRRAAIEILNTCGDERAVDKLIGALEDPDWWVSERAADALAGIGDKRAIPPLVKMLDRNDEAVPVAITALGQLAGPEMLPKIVPYLSKPDKELRIAAIDALVRLADEAHALVVREHVEQAAMVATEDTVIGAASKALTRLDGKFSESGRFTMTGTLGPTRIASPTQIARPEQLQETKIGPPPPLEPTRQSRTLLDDPNNDLSAVTAAQAELPGIDLAALAPGDMIENRYRFVQKIGKGAFGTVVLVEDMVVEEQLILKFLNPNVASDEEMMKRFVHELRYSRRITHKNVIRIYDFLYIAGGYAISMEYFPSHTLGAEIAREKPMPQPKAVGYAIDICTGMQIAHQQGIIHRDLKPANILINDDGLLKIVDFGVAAAAKSGDTQLTKTGYVIGSPKYMAPEQILGKKVDERADIYSLGVILYEMLAGDPPYSRGDHMAVMYQHVQGKAAPLGEVNGNLPREICDVVSKSMSVDKTKRYESMEEFHLALDASVPALVA